MKVLHVFTLINTAGFFDGQFRALTEQGYAIDVVASPADAAEFCRRNSVGFFPVEIARRIDPWADIKAIVRLAGLIRREKFDAVFGHTPKGALVAMIAAWLAGVKRRVYYRHGLIYTTATGLKRFVLKAVERLTALMATKVVNVSSSLSALAVKDRLNAAAKQCVIGSGTCGGIDAAGLFNPDNLAPMAAAQTRAALAIGEADFVAGFCGRLCRDKGIVELVDGFKLFRSQHPDVAARLLLVGPYDTRDILPQRVVAEIESNPDIIAAGSVDHNRLPEYYSVMDTFVFPSYREGFGMTVLEASAMARPILVSQSHGCVDSIVPDITGRYIDINAQSIADGLAAMLDGHLRRRLGEAGRKHVLDCYDHTVLWPQILAFYRETLPLASHADTGSKSGGDNSLIYVCLAIDYRRRREVHPLRRVA